jgi:hypothetical protein
VQQLWITGLLAQEIQQAVQAVKSLALTALDALDFALPAGGWPWLFWALLTPQPEQEGGVLDGVRHGFPASVPE